MPPAKNRKKRADMPLHVTYQNLKDGVANDQRNCTFGQCALSRKFGMDFFIDPNPEAPAIWAEWTEHEDGKPVHHSADLVRRHPGGRETKEEAITIVQSTDQARKHLLRRFPKNGMDFVLTNHTVRASRPGGYIAQLRPGETEEEHRIRLDADRARRKELAQLREAGLAEPAKPRVRRVRARFGRVRQG